MESNEKAKGILAELRRLIFGEQSPELKFETHKLEDGTEITVASLEVGSEVKIGEELAPAGTHKLEDGSSIVVDEAGLITEIIAKEEEAANGEGEGEGAAAPGPLDTPEQMLDATTKFATGTPEERIANLEIICKALMEYSFGWQLREAQQRAINEEAIAVYKNNFEKAGKENEKNSEVIKQLFALVEELAAVHAADPLPVTKKANEFSKVEGKKSKLAKFADAAKKLQEESK